MRIKGFRFTAVMAALAIITFLLAGCGNDETSSDSVADKEGSTGEFTVVTSFYPMYVATINITKHVPGVKVINMTKPQTGCLHDYQLSPNDLKTLEKADVFIINGAGMEAFLDEVIKQQKDLKIIEAAKGIELLKDESGEENPHVWVSISNAIKQVGSIADQLAELDSANAEKYRGNAKEYIQKLESLRDKMHKEIDGIQNKKIITFHEAFPYFAKEFNLEIVAVIEREPGSEPTAKELAETIDMVNQMKIKALFAEPQYSSKAADTISRETDAKVYFLDPGVTGEADIDSMFSYIQIMEENLKTLKEALK